MNDRRLARLKLLAAGAAVVSSTALADVPPKPKPGSAKHPYVNSPRPRDVTFPDGGTLEQQQQKEAEEQALQPPRVNGPNMGPPKKLQK